MEDSQVEAALSLQLAERIGAQRYELWFGAQTRLRIERECLTIHANSEFVRDWLRTNLTDDIHACWQAIAGASATVEFAVDKSHLSARKNEHNGNISTLKGGSEPVFAKRRGADGAVPSEGGRARPDFAFAGFVVGPSNEYAFRAVELTVSGRQQASPLLLCGPTGVGKTHLLRAVLREYRRLHPRSTAVYLTAEQFTTSFIEAIRGSGLPSFRQKCRGATLLLLDDLQFFVGKERTLEELQHTLDTLLSDGRQLVLASDRALAELPSLGRELASRLAGGLTCEIAPPEFATRLEIVRRVGAEIGLAMGQDVLSLVAAQINAGARELKGALNRLQALSLAYNEPVTRDMAERALADLARHSTRTVKLADVQKAVCDVFGVEPAQLRSERKGRALSEPRLMAMWLARKYTRAAWSEIAQFFGRRSHSTVISAHQRVEKLISSQAKIALSNHSCGVEEAIRKLETALRTA